MLTALNCWHCRPLEKLEIIEMLWDDLGSADREIPLPDWVDQEVVRRREELIANPEIGLTHEEVWSRIGSKY